MGNCAVKTREEIAEKLFEEDWKIEIEEEVEDPMPEKFELLPQTMKDDYLGEADFFMKHIPEERWP